MSTYVIMLGRHYLYSQEGLTDYATGADPDRAKVFEHRDRAENVAYFLGGKVVERL